MIKTYYKLTKPGIIMGNAITAVGGFLLASRGAFSLGLFFAMLLGLSCIIAAGCVFNNYYDRGIDEKMARTKTRALVTGKISLNNALIFATTLLLLGSLVLAFFTNFMALRVALTGFIVYVFAYTPMKKCSVHGTLIGSIAGAIPPVVGYCAVIPQFDTAALMLFLIVALWQMPHFYAIAMFRIKEYTAAEVPVLPAVKGMHTTKVQILLYTIAFSVVAVLPSFLGMAGLSYLVAISVLSAFWLILAIRGFQAANDHAWAHKMFRYSLVVITAFSSMISLNI